jgi:kinesin family protein 3/17
MPAATESIRVAIRVRPLNSKEVKASAKRIVTVDSDKGYICVHNPKDPENDEKGFTFDNVYDSDSKQVGALLLLLWFEDTGQLKTGVR